SAVGLTGTGQKLEAFAIIPDTDGDGIPDGLDDCPTVANPPSICSGPGPETCSGLDSQCPSGEHCIQLDSDGDGVRDACDQCNGRPDAGTCDSCPNPPCPGICAGADTDCSCGDGIADFPSEKCDLGMQNGQPDSPCSSTCTIFGKCKGSGTQCDDVSDCP